MGRVVVARPSYLFTNNTYAMLTHESTFADVRNELLLRPFTIEEVRMYIMPLPMKDKAVLTADRMVETYGLEGSIAHLEQCKYASQEAQLTLEELRSRRVQS